MSECTWKGCDAEAAHPRKSQDGSVWSSVCDEHDAKMRQASADVMENKPGAVKRICSMWVKAQGGAEKAARRAMGES